MGSTTNISWLNYSLPDGTYVPGKTFNPWIGCCPVSEGCKNCYASADVKWAKFFGKGTPRHITSDAYWKKPIKWNKEATEKGIRYRVFCGSYCDVFEDREDLKTTQLRLYELIDRTPNLDWLLLTKRPENIPPVPRIYNGWNSWKRDNIWIGVTVENQKQANIRIPQLLSIPAKVRFISCEPLLGKIDLAEHLIYYDGYTFPEWAIIGGESGSNRREMNLDHMKDLAVQLYGCGIPIFIKQDSVYRPGQQGRISDELWAIKDFPQ